MRGERPTWMALDNRWRRVDFRWTPHGARPEGDNFWRLCGEPGWPGNLGLAGDGDLLCPYSSSTTQSAFASRP